MSTTAHDIGLEGLDALTGVDALLLFVGEDERPLQGSAGYVDWRLCGQLSRLLEAGFFTGAAGDSLLLPSDGRLPPARIFAVGLGRRDTLDAGRLAAVLTEAARVLTKAGAQSVALEVPGAEKLDDAARAGPCSVRFFRLSRASGWPCSPTRRSSGSCQLTPAPERSPAGRAFC